MGLIGCLASAVHSFSVCPDKDMEGTRNRISPLPSVSCSAIFNEVNVLPVPQAMISLPLSCPELLKYSCALLRASS